MVNDLLSHVPFQRLRSERSLHVPIRDQNLILYGREKTRRAVITTPRIISYYNIPSP